MVAGNARHPVSRDTLLTGAGRQPLAHHGAVNVPVIRTSTVVHRTLEDYEAHAPEDWRGMLYGRSGTPTTFALEEAVACMEGGHDAIAMPSGLAAITAALCAFAKAGSHVLISDTVYGPTRQFCDNQLRRYGVEVEYYRPDIAGDIEQLLRPNTAAVFCESPGSLTFEMQDIRAIAAAAHARDVPVLADTTWATPYFFRSFECGVDVSIHAATKYIAGHSDVILGLIVTNERYRDTLRRTVSDFGFSVSPDDCYLALRGFRTIGVRMRQQMSNALRVANWLQTRPEVDRVLYPALPDDPGHALWRRDYTGAASLFGVVLQPMPHEVLARWVNSLTLFGIGLSWGGYESLVTVSNVAKVRQATAWPTDRPTLRIHVGLESPEDLIADLARAFAAVA